MQIVVGIATFKGRERYLERTIESLKGQCHKIVVYNNEINDDLTDNGKFFGLKGERKKCYYFTCDDDIIYPPDYVQKTINAIEEHKCIITYHGRILLGKNLNYYRNHKAFRCLNHEPKDVEIDVAGTGVCAFRTDYFKPVNLCDSEHQKMSDVIFSLEAAKQGKRIMMINHRANWIKDQRVPANQTIHGTEMNRCETQTKLANEIWKIKR